MDATATAAGSQAPLSPSPLFPRVARSDLSIRIAESSLNLDTQRPKSAHHSGTGLGALSPVTPAGTYEFDRVLKSARVLKRKRRTNTWKPVYLVLRPNVLSVYNDKEETRLRHQISLVDITAVALRADRKRKGEHEGCFGLYTPARNFHFEANSLLEAEQWVSSIRQESRLDEQDTIALLSSPEDGRIATRITGRFHKIASRPRDGSSSPESIDHTRFRGALRPRMLPMRSSSTVQSLSGPDAAASFSDFSDAPYGPTVDPIAIPRAQRTGEQPATSAGMSSSQRRMMYMASKSPAALRTERSEPAEAFDEEDRVVQQGYLQCLRSRGGVRQWKRCWAVLRPKNLALYKSNEEYTALLILPMKAVVDAGDIDAVSKKNPFCMQIINEDRSYRFSASSEEELSRWVGSLKSVLARRKETAVRLRA